MRIELGKVNRVFRAFGLVLVVVVDPAGKSPTTIELIRWRTFVARVSRPT